MTVPLYSVSSLASLTGLTGPLMHIPYTDHTSLRSCLNSLSTRDKKITEFANSVDLD